MQENKVGEPWYPLFLRFDIQLLILKPLMEADTVNDVSRSVFGLRCLWKSMQCHSVWSFSLDFSVLCVCSCRGLTAEIWNVRCLVWVLGGRQTSACTRQGNRLNADLNTCYWRWWNSNPRSPCSSDGRLFLGRSRVVLCRVMGGNGGGEVQSFTNFTRTRRQK